MKKINIIGCGLMGSQIAGLFSIMGYEVNIWNRSHINQNNLLRQKKITLKLLKAEDKNGEIKFINNFDDIKDNITIESLSEDLELKRSFIEKLDKKVSKEIFSNSSSIKMKKISKKLNLLHFFNPISLKIAEFNKIDKLSEEANNIFVDLKNLNFDLIEVGNFTGFAFNKILFAEISNLFFLIEQENIEKKEILKVFKKINHSLDILHTIDIIGVDISIKILENLKSEYNYYVPQILYQCESNKILGKKNKTSIKTIFESSNYPNKK